MTESSDQPVGIAGSVETGAEPEIIIARNGRPSDTGKRIGVAKGKFKVSATIDRDETTIQGLFSGKPE